MKVYYRISNPGKNAGTEKQKISGFDKIKCLQNAILEFGAENITIIADSLTKKFRKQITDLKPPGHSNDIENIPTYDLRIIDVKNGNGSETFRKALDMAIDENKDYDNVYLLEDDFLHKPGARQALIEACDEYEQYVTCYDHEDKYINKEQGGNPYIQNGGEVTRVMRTASTHWKITNSTVMTFATKVGRLKLDYDVWQEYSKDKITDSFRAFIALNQRNIGCVSCIPGLSTHCETAWLSPFTDWTSNVWFNSQTVKPLEPTRDADYYEKFTNMYQIP